MESDRDETVESVMPTVDRAHEESRSRRNGEFSAADVFQRLGISATRRYLVN